MKVTTVRTGYAAQLANAIKSEQSGLGLGDIYVPKLFCFKQAHSYLSGVSISRTSELKKKALSCIFFTFINEIPQITLITRCVSLCVGKTTN